MNYGNSRKRTTYACTEIIAARSLPVGGFFEKSGDIS